MKFFSNNGLQFVKLYMFSFFFFFIMAKVKIEHTYGSCIDSGKQLANCASAFFSRTSTGSVRDLNTCTSFYNQPTPSSVTYTYKLYNNNLAGTCNDNDYTLKTSIATYTNSYVTFANGMI